MLYTQGKYVVGEIRQTFGAELCAVAISEVFDHANLAPIFVKGTIRSAGFFHVRAAYPSEKPRDVVVECFGQSVGLGVKAHPDDKILLAKTLTIYQSSCS